MSHREFKVPYDDIEKVTIKKFHKNRWTHNGTQKTIVQVKQRGHLKMKHYTWEFPITKVHCDIELKALEGGITSVGVYVKDHSSWLYPFNFNSKQSLELLDVIENKIRTNNWSKLPWQPTNSEFKN